MENSRKKFLKKKITDLLPFALTIMFFVLGSSGNAQEPKRIATLGILAPPSASFFAPRVEAFRHGLHELGYFEGKNISIEYRYAEGKLDRLPQLAAELVHLNVDVILTASEFGALAAKDATSTIPIVFAVSEDAVASGLVSSLARPGRNTTGLTVLSAELGGKRLELIKESSPKVTRVGFLWPSAGPRGDAVFTELEPSAKFLGLKLQSLPIRALEDFEPAFEVAKKQRIEALLTYPTPLLNTAREKILTFATQSRLPGIYPSSEYVEVGGLMSYAPNYTDLFRRSAAYVDKILKGAKPGDLPVERPTKFELVINLKAARQIGLTIPPSVLAQANKVIK
jgi:putative ABC transport system substrate-binding protein